MAAIWRKWLEWFSFVVIWVGIGNAYTWSTQIHIRMFIEQAGVGITWQKESIVAYLLSKYQFVEASLFGVFFGTMFYGIHLLTDRYRLYLWPFWRVVVVKSLAYLLGFIIIFVGIFSIITHQSFFPQEMIPVSISELIFTHTEFILHTFLTFCFFMVIHNFYIQLGKNFGEGKVWPILLGYYRIPRVKNLIFLFIDLKSSTLYAEQLGHLQYSRLIQDCFKDLNSVARKFNAEIYQYVGDEAVLTWEVNEGLKNGACIRMFFAFLKRIENRKEHYQQRYGLVPKFKAGGNMGEVTVAEVGHFKREIAYHGDVVNTASRLQGVCNDYGHHLIISEYLASALPARKEWTLVELANIHLKGRQEKMKVVAVHRTHL